MRGAADLEGPVVMNVGSGGRQSVLQLIAHLEDILRGRLDVRHVPARAGDVRDTQADISLARRLIGYAPAVDFATGLRWTVQVAGDARGRGGHSAEWLITQTDQ